MHGILNPREWYDLNRFLLQLKSHESPVLSLYLPAFELTEGSKILEERGDVVGLEGVRQAVSTKLRDTGPRSGSICLFGWSKNGRSVVKQVRVSKE
ncbi:MAG: hypothetical protein ACE5KH_06480, partial [Candidatus Geothermarchaeales archaeon]